MGLDVGLSFLAVTGEGLGQIALTALEQHLFSNGVILLERVQIDVHTGEHHGFLEGKETKNFIDKYHLLKDRGINGHLLLAFEGLESPTLDESIVFQEELHEVRGYLCYVQGSPGAAVVLVLCVTQSYIESVTELVEHRSHLVV